MNYIVTNSINIPDDEVTEFELAILEYHFLEVLKNIRGEIADQEDINQRTGKIC